MSELGDDLLEDAIVGINKFFPNSTQQTPVDDDDDFNDMRSELDSNPFFDHDSDFPTPGQTCNRILYTHLFGTTARLWDLLILLPAGAFLAFLLIRMNHARTKLRATDSAVYRAFYTLVMIGATASMTRCVISFFLASYSNNIDKMLWLLLRFILMVVELSVVVLGVCSGQLDSRRSVRKVFTVATVVAFCYTLIQGTLELAYPDPKFLIHDQQMNMKVALFGYGGLTFWTVSSGLFALMYLFVLALPILPIRHLVSLGNQKMQVYAFFLFVLNLVQMCGSLFALAGFSDGICFVNLANYVYLTAFVPIVYFTFLMGFFKVAQPSLLFTYQAQVDDFDDGDLPPSVSMEFSADSHESSNTPIVLNTRRTGSSGFADPFAPPPTNGIASPDSVVNYNFGN